MAHSSWTLQIFGIVLGPGLMKIDILDTWGTFDGFKIAFGGFLCHFLAPVIKVIGNSFLTPELLLALFGHFF